MTARPTERNRARRLYETMRDAMLAERRMIAGPYLDFDLLPSGEQRAWCAVAAMTEMADAGADCDARACRHGGCQGRKPDASAVTTAETFDCG